MKRHQLAFGLLILAQALHSIEEYVGRLWASFPPADFVSGLVSQDRELGFLLLNVALVTFGTWCYLVPIRRRWPSATGITLGWSLVELINGVGHPLWSLRQGGYTPGLATAPVLLVLAISLIVRTRAIRDLP
ncbi:MAG TPA: HXXEE domain-containing protein [Gemmatimonadaceae bacterium]